MIRVGKVEADQHYTIISTAWLRDIRLSRRARGLLAELKTHREGWSQSVQQLVKAGPEGRDAIYTAIRELEECGYLLREQPRQGDGRWESQDWVLQDPDPVPGNPQRVPGNPEAAEPEAADPHHKDTILKNTKEGSSSAMPDGFEAFWDAYGVKMDKPTALRAWAKAVKVATPEQIMAGVEAYHSWRRALGDRAPTQKYPATWLNANAWENDYSRVRSPIPRPKVEPTRSEWLDSVPDDGMRAVSPWA